MNTKLLKESTTVHIRREDKMKLKLLAVWEGKSIFDYLTKLINEIYAKRNPDAHQG